MNRDNQAEPTKPNRPHGGPGMGRPVEKAKDLRGSWGKLFSYLAGYRWQIATVIVLVIINTILIIWSPKLLGNITDHIVDDFIAIKTYDATHEHVDTSKLPAGTTLEEFQKLSQKQAEQKSANAQVSQQNQGDPEAMQKQLDKLTDAQRDRLMNMDITKRPTMGFDAIGRIGVLLIVIYIASAVIGYIETWVITNITQKTAYRLRRELSQKINTLPLSYFDKHPFGDVLSRITNDVDTVAQNLTQVISSVVTSTATVIGILVMMLSISLPLTLVALIMLPISGVAVGLVASRSQKYFKKQQKILGDLNGHIEETYAGHNIIKIFGTEKQVAKTFQKYNSGLNESSWKAQFISGTIFPVMNLVSNFGYVITTILGGYLVIKGKIRIGEIQAFIQYNQQFTQPIMQLANASNTIQLTAAAAERVFEFLEQTNEPASRATAKLSPTIHGNVEFNHVKFGYDADKIIINDFTADIKAGQKVAIVGPTGAGKTTLVNLLMRFYELDGGNIKIDGVDISKLKRSTVRQKFSMVLQDTWLFSGAIRDNLLYAKPNASQADIERAVRAARAEHIIKSLPDGYDTVLDENASNVSAGEKQLLTIARAMLADAPILILDEATSNVDTRTETLIQSAMDELMKGRTSFVIAHRLSTIRNADLILVLNHGDIVESGNHDELMAQGGFYAELYNSQFIDA